MLLLGGKLQDSIVALLLALCHVISFPSILSLGPGENPHQEAPQCLPSRPSALA